MNPRLLHRDTIFSLTSSLASQKMKSPKCTEPVGGVDEAHRESIRRGPFGLLAAFKNI